MNKIAVAALVLAGVVAVVFAGVALDWAGGPLGSAPNTQNSPVDPSPNSTNETTTRTTAPTTQTTTETTTQTTTSPPVTTTTTTPGNERNESKPDFRFIIDSIQECGPTCRNVTATLKNNGTAPANNVTVETNIYAGDNLIWNNTEEVGRLEPNETYTSNQEITLSGDDVFKIQQNDGIIIIETIVRHDGGSKTFTRDREVM